MCDLLAEDDETVGRELAASPAPAGFIVDLIEGDGVAPSVRRVGGLGSSMTTDKTA